MLHQGPCKKFFSLIWVHLLYQLCFSSSQCFAMTALLQTSQKLFLNQQHRHWQGRNEVSWRKFGAPIFEPEVFRKQIHCIEESTCDIVGTFRRSPQSFGAPIVIRRLGNCAHHAPLFTSWALSQVLNLATIYVKIFGSMVCQVFYETLLTSATEPLGNITCVVGQKHSTMLSFKLTRSLTTQTNHFTKPSYCYYDTLHAWCSFVAS